VGGTPAFWKGYENIVKSIDVLNLTEDSMKRSSVEAPNLSLIVGDGCALAQEDGAYDLVFSNSVIEHVGSWPEQCAFAREVRRVGRRLWVQTPALACPIEPHFLGLFVHWLPLRLRRYAVAYLTPWGWIHKRSLPEADKAIANIQLLSKQQFQALFPDCQILTERLLGIIPKSYIAYRT
jgi:hypothetical protein